MSDEEKNDKKSRKSKSKKSKKSKKKSNNNNNDEVDNSDNYQNQHSSSSIISTRAYLEQNVTPLIQEAMIECAKKRPSNPIEFIGNYLLDRAHGK